MKTAATKAATDDVDLNFLKSAVAYTIEITPLCLP